MPIRTECIPLYIKQTHTMSVPIAFLILNVFADHLILLQSGDVESNPGPPKRKYTPRFPCGNCAKACRWGSKCIRCDGCETWFHKNCLDIHTANFDAYEINPDLSWLCCQCGLPQLASSLFSLSNITTDHSSVNSSPPRDHSSPNRPPLATSSPTRANKPPPKKWLRVITANFGGIRGKKTQFWNMISCFDPDIIIGTESHLDDSVFTAEIFPANFSVWRKDRSTGPKGGVFIAVSTKLDAEEVQLETGCETNWITVKLKNQRKAYIGSFYRPPSDNINTLQTWITSTNEVLRISNDSLIISGGDFNLPGIDWKSEKFVPPAPNKNQCELFLEFLKEYGTDVPTAYVRQKHPGPHYYKQTESCEKMHNGPRNQ